MYDLFLQYTIDILYCNIILFIRITFWEIHIIFFLSLRSKLLEKQNDCADSTVQCVRQALQSIQSWNQLKHANLPCISATSMQVCLIFYLYMWAQASTATEYLRVLMCSCVQGYFIVHHK